ncbi:hypothetical protein ON010_g14425 [Phytophthora cinnamomi]|nr:hypothetical protein ON010_g14425 [Phytophthora cinnamomi]
MKKPISQRAGTSLNEVLAFLDTLDSCESDFRDSSSGEKIEGKPEVGILVTGGCKELNSRTTVQLRQQQKVEKEKLQDRFVPYSTESTAPQESRAPRPSIATSATPESFGRAEAAPSQEDGDDVSIRLKRQRSERLNRKLKSILESQAQVHSTYEIVSTHESCRWLSYGQGIEVVFRDQPTAGRDAIQLDFNASSFAELSHSVETMRLEVDNVLPALNDCSTLAFCSQQPRKNRDTTKSSFCRIRKKKCTPDQVNGVVALLDGAQRVDGVSVFRRFEEGDRTILLGATLWTFRDEGFQFEDRSWTVISPSPMDPLGASVSQNYCRMHQKNSDPAKPYIFVGGHESIEGGSAGFNQQKVAQHQTLEPAVNPA